ncbi:Uncharacterized protein FKW44_010442 [Caligus rogercresseyi]|uniref:Uncharacterized protein n=1 Tax=Caligus rogercresseyi TaxID=217165 RepID=A0A7T8HGX5_CALRO|nr:Uncharacterized protein FKW44_010442 [Caligus rogercresseyi]
MAGFSSTGIHPLNSDIFPEEAFLPFDVTDRPAPAIAGKNEQGNEQPLPPNFPCRRPTPSKEAVTTPLQSKPLDVTDRPAPAIAEGNERRRDPRLRPQKRH